MASAKRVTAGILFSIALVAMLAFLFLLFVAAENVDTVPGVDMVFEIAIAMAVVFAAIAIVLLILVLTRKKPDLDDGDEVYFISGADDSSAPLVTGETDTAGQPGGPTPPGTEAAPEVVAHDLRSVPLVLRSWSLGDAATYSFPCAVHHGVYANDYVEIGGGRELKLRTLLAGPQDIGQYVVDHPEPAEATAENEGWDPDADGAETRTDDPAGGGAGESRGSDRPSRPRRSEASSDDFFREMEHRFS